MYDPETPLPLGSTRDRGQSADRNPAQSWLAHVEADRIAADPGTTRAGPVITTRCPTAPAPA